MTDQEFVQELSRVLSRLYDLAYLETSPLAPLAEGGLAGGSRGKELRRDLLDAIEAMRPPEGTPASDVAWRPYRILEGRFVACLSRGEVEDELALGKSQYYREYARALSALASILWRQWQVQEPGLAREGMREQPDALALARAEAAELSRQESPQNVDVLTTVRDILGVLEPTMRQRQITVDVQAAPNAILVCARPSVFRQSLLIPLSACAELLARGRALVRLSQRGGTVTVRIEAQGVADAAASVGADAGHLEAMGVFLKAAGGALLYAEQWASGLQVQLSYPAVPESPAFAPALRALLLVDNDPTLHALFQRYLEGEPWIVRYAVTAADALAFCEREPPALILLDVLLPGQDGWHLLTQLKANPHTADIPVVICSVLKQPQLALTLGAAGYLQKPVTLEALRQAVRQWGGPPPVMGAAPPTPPAATE